MLDIVISELVDSDDVNDISRAPSSLTITGMACALSSDISCVDISLIADIIDARGPVHMRCDSLDAHAVIRKRLQIEDGRDGTTQDVSNDIEGETPGHPRQGPNDISVCNRAQPIEKSDAP